MIRNLKLTYILLTVFTSITLAFKTLTGFFGGVGINFIALVGLGFVVMLIALKDRQVAKNCWDIYVLNGILLFLELIMFIACEFGDGLFTEGFWKFQNVISVLGLFVLAYTLFRFTMEFLNKKLRLIEIMLGNEKPVKKEKKTKEVSNGSLLEKPNHKEDSAEEVAPKIDEEKPENTENNNEPIVVETEE